MLLLLPQQRAVPGAAGPPPAAPGQSGDRRAVETINLGGPAAEALLTRVSAELPAASAAVEAFWGTDWPQRITVTATGTESQFAALASGTVDGGRAAQWSDIAAVTVADRVDTEHRTAGGQQVVFAPGAVTMSTPALRIVLAHELFHYAARIDTAADAPRWLTEGVADFVARPSAPIAPAGGPAAAAQLPTDAELTATGPARDLAYDRAWWFARFVADGHGPGTLARLYRTACGPGHPDVPTAVERVLGAGLPDVLADWQRWLVKPQRLTSAG